MNRLILFSIGLVLIISLVLSGGCTKPAPAPAPAPATTKAPAPAPTTAPATAATPAPAGVIELRLSHHWPVTELGHLYGFSVWKDMVDKATNGKVKITIFPGGSLAPGGEAWEATQRGICDIAILTEANKPGKFSLTTDLLTLPFLGVDGCLTGTRVLYDLIKKYPQIIQQYEPDVKLLWIYSTQVNQYWTKKPINDISFFKGLKISSAGISGELMKKVGAVPTVIVMGEVPSALQTGVLDAVEMAPGSIQAYGLWDVLGYGNVCNPSTYGAYCVIMNRQKWESLPPDIKGQLEGVCGFWGRVRWLLAQTGSSGSLNPG